MVSVFVAVDAAAMSFGGLIGQQWHRDQSEV
jgi:hypothetical protein